MFQVRITDIHNTLTNENIPLSIDHTQNTLVKCLSEKNKYAVPITDADFVRDCRSKRRGAQRSAFEVVTCGLNLANMRAFETLQRSPILLCRREFRTGEYWSWNYRHDDG